MTFEDYFASFCCAFIAMLLPIGALASMALRRIRALEARITVLEESAGAPVPTAITSEMTPAIASEILEGKIPLPKTQETLTIEPAVLAPGEPSAVPQRKPSMAEKLPQQPKRQPRVPKQKREWQLPPLINWLSKMHVMVQIGLLLFLIGVGLFLRFAFDQGWISVPVRHIGAAVIGLIVAGIGVFFRKRRRNYGLALQGGGIGILYLTVFSAHRFFDLLPESIAFVLYVVLSVAAVGLALFNDAWILAATAQVGAFMAPLLAGDPDASHLGLFGYLLILNIAMAVIAWFKAWRITNVVGLIGTIVLTSMWIGGAYETDLFWSTEPFMVAFFVIFTLLPVFFARHASTQLGQVFDNTLLYLTPIWTLITQGILTDHFERGLLLPLIGMAVLYIALTVALYIADRSREPDAQRFGYLRNVFLFWAAVCIALAVPAAFEANVTAAIWAVLGLGYLAGGVHQKRAWPVILGGAVQLGAALAYFAYVDDNAIDWQPFILNGLFIGGMMIGLAGLASSYLLHRTDDKRINWLQYPFFAWGLLWWVAIGLVQILEGPNENYQFAGSLSFIALTMAALYVVGRLLKWTLANKVAPYGLFILPLLTLLRIGDSTYLTDDNLLTYGGWYAWPIAFIAQYLVLKGQDSRKLAPVWHVISLWTVVAWFISEGVWGIGQLFEQEVAWYALPVLGGLAVAILLISLLRDMQIWPLKQFKRAYLVWGVLGLIAVGMGWTLITSTFDGLNTAPLPYIPILNTYEMPLGIFLIACGVWIWRLDDGMLPHNRYYAKLGLGISAFLLSNFVIARGVHHLGNVDYNFIDLFTTPALQTIYAIYWSIVAVVLMFASNRRKWLTGWILGVILLAITVLKLFLVDLTNASSIARIVSFLAVGALIVIVAYFAPAPAREPSEDAISSDAEADTAALVERQPPA